jgi:hypothetical protein
VVVELLEEVVVEQVDFVLSWCNRKCGWRWNTYYCKSRRSRWSRFRYKFFFYRST